MEHTSLGPRICSTFSTQTVQRPLQRQPELARHTRGIYRVTRQGGQGEKGQLAPGRAPTELHDAAGHRTSLVFTFISLGSFLHSKAQLTCRHLPWSAARLTQGERGRLSGQEKHQSPPKSGEGNLGLGTCTEWYRHFGALSRRKLSG